jgi:N-acetylglucosamine-6-phosphate deacetylase
MNEFALAADIVFDGTDMHRDAAVTVLADGTVGAVGPVAAGTPVQRLPKGAWLAPGFIDLQVNGGGGVLFNDEPTPEGIAAIVRAHRRFGTTGLLPTLVTDTDATMHRARAAVAAAMRCEPGVLGIHFEGPFLSRSGVHDKSLMRSPGAADLAFLTAGFAGVTLVTLAPETVPAGFIAALEDAGVRVALGHSEASYEDARAALAEGCRGFTHLFNAMPPLGSRAPGPVAAALETPEAWYGLIVDGVHVAPAMLRLALRGGVGRPLLVTDAMPPVGGTHGDFSLQGRPVRMRDGALRDEAGNLAGSVLDMASAVRNCVRLLDLPLAGALRMASAAPAAALGLGDRLGSLKRGYRADIVALDPEAVAVLGTWVAGAGGLHR